MNIKEYVLNALETFKNDPADTDFQRGYEAALKEIADCIDAKTINGDN